LKRVLSIAGSDSSAGGGVQGDLKAFLRCGVYGTTALTSITAGNTVEITGAHDLPPEAVVAQIEAVVSDIGADAVKTGMLSNAAIVSAVAGSVRRMGLKNVVVDPVMVAENGALLLRPDAVEALVSELLPLADAITPNVQEAFALIGERVDEGRLRECAVELKDLGPAAVIVTGGKTRYGYDLLFDGERFVEIEGPVHSKDTAHGAGCAHSSALASFLARGFGLEEAARRARSVASEAVGHGLEEIGAGPGPVHALGPVLNGQDLTNLAT
jgi:hydroxymethylpyrimidine/phosphomethylpyrimidine kinase